MYLRIKFPKNYC